ncbi:MAPEG family protein [Parashewanella spongiae]|uniref:MAPEG family protein n=1 Tax=Parashewanella spongiae TaxID=342950 RepID=A0A3A6TAB1_9GAMM|nr:MAPEG family protein [Parashewanella spongiae]MCL1080241.1 MAPEG family protein [Parashewanella spongiae]RJY01905.1 MAPEG family protein [Parashewanella spongiae]
MSTLLICLFIAMLLPFLAKAPVAYAMAKLGGYDNQHPREQQSKLTGFGARALAGHQNAFESLLVFGMAVLAVIATGDITETAVTLAIVHIVARIMYHILYLIDLSTLRSLSWFVGIGASFCLFWQAV